jgi:hypothetical protein
MMHPTIRSLVDLEDDMRNKYAFDAASAFVVREGEERARLMVDMTVSI